MQWLASGEGQETVAALRGVDPLQARSAFPDLPAEQLAAALTQAKHRPADFPLRLVTVDGVQQASPVAVAQRRARRLADSGVRTVIDAGCGIGLDSWAFAQEGLHVVAYESDPHTAQIARVNLADLDVEVVTADVTATPLPTGALFVDPARRRAHQDAGGRPIRIQDPQQWRPPWSWVLAQRTHGRPVVARTRPGQRDLPQGAEWHCSSIGRRLVDATLWFGELGQVDRRASVHDGQRWHGIAGSPLVPEVGDVGGYITDPDPAIVRAGLVSNAAASAGAHLLDPRLAFLTGEAEPPTWIGRSMQVLAEVTLKDVASSCRQRGLTAVTLWSRGFDRPPSLGLPQGRDAIVVAARVGMPRRTRVWIGLPFP